MTITNEQFEKLREEVRNIHGKTDHLRKTIDNLGAYDAREALTRLDTQEKSFNELYHDVRDRLADSNNTSQALTEVTKQLLSVTKDQRDLFQKSMLWIAGVFAGMHYISASEGLKIIIEEPAKGE